MYKHTEHFVPMFSLSNIGIYLLINLLSQTFIQPLYIHLPTHAASHTTLQNSANPCIRLYFILYLPILSLLSARGRCHLKGHLL